MQSQLSENAPHFIGGSTTPSASGAILDVDSPWTGQKMGEVSVGKDEDIQNAVQTAREAFKTWGSTPVKQRVQILYRFKQLVEDEIDTLAKLISRENGKMPAEAKAEIEKGLEVVEYACSIPNMPVNNILEVSRGVDCYSKLFPIGVVAGITPFNFPAMVPMWMFPIALALGNAFILKPSEQVPFTPIRLAELLKQAGLPDGVFTIINGDAETAKAITQHPDITAVGFVGSSKVANWVHQEGTALGKRVLAMGGAKNHLIVMPDADMDITAGNIVASFTGCSGQRCMAASVLVLVGDSEPVFNAICEKASQLKPAENIGPLINPAAVERVKRYLDLAESEGGKFAVDGRWYKADVEGEGYFVAPTIIDGLNIDSACVKDEIFAPVLSVLRAKDLDEALEIENQNPYGNAASIFTTQASNSQYFIQRASSGMVGVNIGVPVPREPFSFGGWNQSRFGIGDITGIGGIQFWTQSKKITQKWSARSSQNWMS